MKFQQIASQITLLQASVVKRQADENFILEMTESPFFLDGLDGTTEGFEFPAITTEGPIQLMTTDNFPVTDLFTFPDATTQGPPLLFSTPEPYQSTPMSLDLTMPTATGLPFVTTDSKIVFPDLATTNQDDFGFWMTPDGTATTPLFDFEDFKTSPQPFEDVWSTAPDWIFQTTASDLSSKLATLPAKLLQNSTKTSTSTTFEPTVTTQTSTKEPTQSTTTSTESLSMTTSSIDEKDTNLPIVDKNEEGHKSPESPDTSSNSVLTSTTLIKTSTTVASTSTSIVETSSTFVTNANGTQTSTETTTVTSTSAQPESTTADMTTQKANSTSSPPSTEATTPASSRALNMCIFVLSVVLLL